VPRDLRVVLAGRPWTGVEDADVVYVEVGGWGTARTGYSHRMGADDKIDNQADKLKGKAKETAGTLNGDEELRTEGKADQTKGNIKQAGEKVKDAFKS
jgi:uncharacterized protein YjbJ (UPF0337 family)